MSYRVEITPIAEAEIDDFIRYVAEERSEPLNASRLLEAILDAIEALAKMPRRCPRAPEDALVDFEVRVLIVKKTLLVLFTLDDAQTRVTILGFRHGSHSPLDLSGRA